ncbi:MAG TPA: DUF998 domain-containing protein [Candidatus Nitrosopolaris sp.]|nr:DUF998 domain-containing protein [Candidatus Nitrosopolaris sp.]
MVAKTKPRTTRPKHLLAIATLAALCFNNWLLGPWLNHRLFAHNGSVSEFSAVDQPHYAIFRTLDVFSGLLFILLAILLAQYISLTDKWRRVLLWSLAILGAANFMDALFTLHCSETLDVGCRIPVIISWHRLQLPDHAYSSVIISISYLTLPLSAWFYARARELRLLTALSALAVLAAVATFISAISEYLSDKSFTVRTSGAGQEAQMLLLGVWFICLAWDITSGGAKNPSGEDKLPAA